MKGRVIDKEMWRDVIRMNMMIKRIESRKKNVVRVRRKERIGEKVMKEESLKKWKNRKKGDDKIKGRGWEKKKIEREVKELEVVMKSKERKKR